MTFRASRFPETFGWKEERYKWASDNDKELIKILNEEAEDNFDIIKAKHNQDKNYDKFAERTNRWSREYIRRLSKVLSDN